MSTVIHIAGSKGKGTTAHLIAKLLEWKGKTVGLFTSPPILEFNEQVQVNGVIIGADELQMRMGVERSKRPELSEFEALTLAAFQYFEDENCDYVVLECGWGGKRDATNWIDHKELTILTHVELEHTEVLGSTLEEITREKLGICRPGVPLLTSPSQDPAVMQTIHEQGIEPLLAPSITLGRHHPECVGLAFLALEQLGFTVNEEDQRGLMELHIPGRFEQISFGPHTLILDGAHTYDSIHFVQEQVKALENAESLDVYWRIHFLSDKRPDLWSFFPDHHTKWVPLEDPRAGSKPDSLEEEGVEETLEWLRGKSAPVIVVWVGSFKLVAKVKKVLQSATL